MQDKTRNTIITICALVVAVAATAATTLYFVKSTKNTNQTMQAVPNATVTESAAAANVVTANLSAPNVSAASETMAQIIAIKPHFVTIQIPYTSCHQQTRVIEVQQKSGPPVIGTVIGGVAGGLLGNQVGGGNGRTIATAVGAVGGALAGGSIENSMNRPVQKTIVENHCIRKFKATQKQRGFEVTYLYQGVQDTRILLTAPVANQIPVTIMQAAPSLQQQ